MRGWSHMGIGMSISVATGAGSFGTGAIMIGSVLPDLLDHAFASYKSGGKQYDRDAYQYFWAKAHRKITHWWPIPALLLFLSLNVIMFAAIVNQISFYISIGILGHIVADLFSKMGVPVIFPFDSRKNLGFGLLRVGGKMEYFTVFIIFVLSIIYSVQGI